MAVSYKKLWHLLLDKDMKKKELAEKANLTDYSIKKLQLMNPRSFVELYDDGLQVEEIESGKKETTKASSSRPYTQSTKVVKVNVVRSPRQFSNFDKPLSKIFDRLENEGLIKPEPAKSQPNPNAPNYHPNTFCRFHQVHGHSIDNCIRLKHCIQDLVDEGKIPDLEADA